MGIVWTIAMLLEECGKVKMDTSNERKQQWRIKFEEYNKCSEALQ